MSDEEKKESAQQTENDLHNELQQKKNEKKKRHPVKKLLIGLLVFILVLLVIIGGWILYSSLDKKKALSVLPSDFAVYLRSNRLWDAVNPIVDVKALDVFLADPAYGEVRSALMGFRASNEIRNNKWISFAANRRVDAAMYSDGSFAVAIDMGPLSSATRLAKLASRFVTVNGLTLVASGNNTWFEYTSGTMTVYAKPYHNLLLVSNSKKTFQKMCTGDNLKSYTVDKVKLFSSVLNNPFRIACDVNTLLAFDETIENQFSPIIKPLLTDNPLALVDFGITDDDMHLQFSAPLKTLTPETIDSFEKNSKISSATLSIMSSSSSKSKLLEQFSDNVQYYTLLNVAPLEQLKEAAVPLVPASTDINGLWSTGEKISKTLFSVSLEDLLFSWTGKELAVLGLEGKKDPVFVMEISNEDKRKEVFDKVFSSWVVNESDSLVLDGVRVPQMKLPDFLQSIIHAFGVTVAKPYYYVGDGYIYFSESAENIVNIASNKRTSLLKDSDTFESVSSKHKKETSLSIFYNLARSVPFFLNSKSSFSQALQLYNIGRVDMRIERNREGDGNLIILLQAISRKDATSTAVPGYPITLEGKHNLQLCRSMAYKPQLLFWVQDETTVKMYSADSSATATFECDSSMQIIPSAENAKPGVLWAVSSDGMVYLFDKELQPVENFPVALHASCSVAPVLYLNKLLVCTEDGGIHLVATDGTVAEITLESPVKIKASPTVVNSTIAFYNKSLSGSLYVVVNGGESSQAVSTIPITSIAFGSPAVISSEDTITMAFITQNGMLSLYKNTNPVLDQPYSFDKVYYVNAITNGKYFYVLSNDGQLSRVTQSGEVTSIQLSNVTAKSATLIAEDFDGDGTKELFVNGDSNLIYGFNQNLEAIAKFPIVGIGRPVFVDLNVDNKMECIAISLDNKLNAYQIQNK